MFFGNPSSDSSFSLKNQARLLARTLIQEITLDPPPSTQKDYELFNEVPSRKDLDFRQSGGVDIPKAILGPDLSANEGSEFFCSGHGEFVLGSGTDIDHVFSYKKIRDRQIELLYFLNSNLSFADLFINEPEMNNFFKIESGKVRATRYFFKQCYNAIDNLMLLCHACNVKKSDKNPRTSFEEKVFFGTEFIEDLQDRPDGGEKEGVIFPRVYVTGSTPCSIELAGMIFLFHAGDDGIGFGEYARNWFFETSESVLKIQKEFKEVNFAIFKKDLEAVRSLMLKSPTAESKRTLTRLCSSVPILLSVYQVFTKISASASTSDSEDSSGKRGQQNDVEKAMLAIVKFAHIIKKIKKIFVNYFGENLSKGVSTLCRSLNTQEEIQLDEWRLIHLRVSNFLPATEFGVKKDIQEARKIVIEGHQEYTNSARLASVEAIVSEKEKEIEELKAQLEQANLRLAEADVMSEPTRKKSAKINSDNDMGSNNTFLKKGL